jgi:hypothetical protein
MKGPLMFHNAPVKGIVKLVLSIFFFFSPIIHVAKYHLHNICQKQVLFLNSHVRQQGLAFVQYIQVLVIIFLSPFHHQLYNFKIKGMKILHGVEL